VSIGEFGATSFLARSGATTISIAIGNLMGRPGPLLQQSAYCLASLIATTVIATGVLAAIGARRVSETGRRVRSVTSPG